MARREEEALSVISDWRAGNGRIAEYRLRWRVENVFLKQQK
jgi:hypothetical protein